MWDFDGEPDRPTEEIDIVVDFRFGSEERRDQQPEDGGQPERQYNALTASALIRLRHGSEGPDGIPVASYPEWDHAQGLERPDWTTVLERDAPAAHEAAGAAFVADRDVMQRVDSMTRRVSIGRSVREKGQRDGDILDLDACVAAAVARRSGKTPEDGVFQRVTPGPHDLAVLLLLDLSESTADLDGNGRSVLAPSSENSWRLWHGR